ncbi:hypothetical protein M1513_00685 [Patescibacteria group bacterium]|nr:hypothetical protein [Patescibacteria group bacterium]
MDKFYRKGGVLLMVSFILALAIAAAAYIYSIGSKATDHLSRNLAVSSSQEAIFPVSWGDLGRKMVEVGDSDNSLLY